MSLIRWEPFRELTGLRESMDSLFDEHFFRPYRFFPHLHLEDIATVPLDMYQTENEVVLKAALAGVNPSDVDITITGDTLTLKGEAKVTEELNREDYLHQERRYGAFSRSVLLPPGLQTDKAEAVFADGVLTLTIPKAEEVKPKQIKVKAQQVIESKKA